MHTISGVFVGDLVTSDSLLFVKDKVHVPQMLVFLFTACIIALGILLLNQPHLFPRIRCLRSISKQGQLTAIILYLVGQEDVAIKDLEASQYLLASMNEVVSSAWLLVVSVKHAV